MFCLLSPDWQGNNPWECLHTNFIKQVVCFVLRFVCVGNFNSLLNSQYVESFGLAVYVLADGRRKIRPHLHDLRIQHWLNGHNGHIQYTTQLHNYSNQYFYNVFYKWGYTQLRVLTKNDGVICSARVAWTRFRGMWLFSCSVVFFQFADDNKSRILIYVYWTLWPSIDHTSFFHDTNVYTNQTDHN